MVLRARVLLLSSATRVLRGQDALWVYRLLTQVDREAFGSKLAYVLIDASRSPLVRELPEQRLLLLKEAVAAAEALNRANPYRQKMLTRALDDIDQLQRGSAGEHRSTGT